MQYLRRRVARSLDRNDGRLFLEGLALRADQYTMNGRIYPESILRNAIIEYLKRRQSHTHQNWIQDDPGDPNTYVSHAPIVPPPTLPHSPTTRRDFHMPFLGMPDRSIALTPTDVRVRSRHRVRPLGLAFTAGEWEHPPYEDRHRYLTLSPERRSHYIHFVKMDRGEVRVVVELMLDSIAGYTLFKRMQTQGKPVGISVRTWASRKSFPFCLAVSLCTNSSRIRAESALTRTPGSLTGRTPLRSD